MNINADEATVYAVTDASPFEHITLRLSEIRVIRPVGNRSPSLDGWFEVLYTRGLPARPYRALVAIDQLTIALGWFAGFDHNRPIADAFENRPFHPERSPPVTHSRAWQLERVAQAAAVAATVREMEAAPAPAKRSIYQARKAEAENFARTHRRPVPVGRSKTFVLAVAAARKRLARRSLKERTSIT